MQEILVPRVSANEDVVRVVNLPKKNSGKCREGDVLCVLESTKASFEVSSPVTGHFLITVKVGVEVSVGDLIGYVDVKAIDSAKLKKSAQPKKLERESHGIVVSKKAQELLDKHGLLATVIKQTGTLKSEEVLAYLEKGNKRPAGESLRYQELDKIMKLSSSGEASMADVQKLKETLNLAFGTYKERWNRAIPALDLLFDRWVSGEALGFGRKSNISHLSYIFGDVEVGENTFIGPFTVIDGSGGLEIGSNCSIAAGVHIYSHDTIARALSGDPNHEVIRVKTKISDNCFLGPHAVITKGVTIGCNCFVGANSVVTRDVPDFTAVVGNPAEIVGRVEIDKEKRVRIVGG